MGSGQLDNEMALTLERGNEENSTELWKHLELLETQWHIDKIHSSTDKEFHSTLIDISSKDNKRKRKKIKKVVLATAEAAVAAANVANAANAATAKSSTSDYDNEMETSEVD